MAAALDVVEVLAGVRVLRPVGPEARVAELAGKLDEGFCSW